ncbi:MAG: hypothetical protein HGA19_18135 [Oscillochloris sp.]|nr:hypothetical protein [Oscillochloris sp.]
MPTQVINVQSQIFGNPTPELVLQPVFIDVDLEYITVAELIRQTVAAQITNLLATYHQNASRVQQAFAIQYDVQADLATALQAKQSLPSSINKQSPIDLATAQQRALQAFEERAYLVLINGQQVERLDDLVICSPQTQATFLRLMPLVGG